VVVNFQAGSARAVSLALLLALQVTAAGAQAPVAAPAAPTSAPAPAAAPVQPTRLAPARVTLDDQTNLLEQEAALLRKMIEVEQLRKAAHGSVDTSLPKVVSIGLAQGSERELSALLVFGDGRNVEVRAGDSLGPHRVVSVSRSGVLVQPKASQGTRTQKGAQKGAAGTQEAPAAFALEFVLAARATTAAPGAGSIGAPMPSGPMPSPLPR